MGRKKAEEEEEDYDVRVGGEGEGAGQRGRECERRREGSASIGADVKENEKKEKEKGAGEALRSPHGHDCFQGVREGISETGVGGEPENFAIQETGEGGRRMVRGWRQDQMSIRCL